MTTTKEFRYELSEYARGRLSAATLGIDAGFGVDDPGIRRYEFYRRHGHGVQDAYNFALAWAKNATEQYERRLGHDTGAEGWRAIN